MICATKIEFKKCNIIKQKDDITSKQNSNFFRKDVAVTNSENCCDGTVFVTVDIWHCPDNPTEGITVDHYQIGTPCPICPPQE